MHVASSLGMSSRFISQEYPKDCMINLEMALTLKLVPVLQNRFERLLKCEIIAMP
jgi:hypothetical protein